MEKNVTPNMKRKKPNFFKIFIYVFSIFLVLQMIFGRKDGKDSVSPILATFKKKEVKRNLVPFETVSLKGNFNSVGLRLDDVVLTKYKQTMDVDSKDVEMLEYIEQDGKNTKKSSYVEFGLMTTYEDKAFLFPSDTTEWNVVSKTGSSISLSWVNKNNVKFLRNLSFDENYMLTVKDEVVNSSSSVIEFYPYARVVKSHNMKLASPSSHIGFTGFLNDDLEEHTYSELEDEKSLEFSSKDGWLGFGSDYFMSVLVPDQNNENFTARVLELGSGNIPTVKSDYKQFQADFVREMVKLEVGKTSHIVSRFYVGAKVSDIIDGYEKEFSIPKFDLVIDYGLFYILSKPFTQVLKVFNNWTGNFGLAIILFTILIRILMFPIAQKSFKSMEKMKKMQPEMKRIQALYAKDKPRMNMEMAMLYKKSKVNPLSGCLPMLLQIPVFFALYKSLVISIEMRHAPFFGWLQNLSAPDPTTVFNMFGLLPYEPWTWLPHLGVLPLVMGFTMYLQQALQPAMSADPMQAKLMKFLPLIFTFMFAGLPSGLVLYWTVNNILSILQQKFVR